MATTTSKAALRKPDGTDLVNVVSDISANMDRIDKFSDGELNFKQVVANQTGITTVVDITGLVTDALTIVANQLIKIEFDFLISSSVGGDTVQVNIQEGATVLKSVSRALSASVGVTESISAFLRLAPTAAAHTYKLTIQRSTGTGSLTLQASATFPGQLLVTDLGQL